MFSAMSLHAFGRVIARVTEPPLILNCSRGGRPRGMRRVAPVSSIFFRPVASVRNGCRVAHPECRSRIPARAYLRAVGSLIPGSYRRSNQSVAVLPVSHELAHLLVCNHGDPPGLRPVSPTLRRCRRHNIRWDQSGRPPPRKAENSLHYPRLRSGRSRARNPTEQNG